MSTAVIGTTFVDVKGFPFGVYDPRGRNLGSVITVHGGVGRNVAENFANSGMPVSYVGMLEDSAFGRDVERHLLEIGVGLDHVLRVSKDGIGMWLVVLDEKGNLAGSISKMPNTSVFEEYLALHGEEIVKKHDHLVLEMDLNEQIAEPLINLAERYHKPVFSIVGNMSVILARPDLLKKTACFICNEIEASKFFGDEAFTTFSPDKMMACLPDAAREAGIGSMVVTMGERGAVYFENDTAGFCPVVETEVVDTSGAGDAFFSGTVMGLIRGIPLPEAVKYGARLAAATIGTDKTVCPVNRVFFQQ